MIAISPSVEYFQSVVLRILLVISGVETNPGPAYENNSSSRSKKSNATKENVATPSASNTSILRTMYETGAMIMHKADSSQDLSKMPEIQEHRKLITRLDNKKFDEPNKQTSFSQHHYNKPIFKSPSLDVLSKVMSQQNHKTLEVKLQGLTEEVAKMKRESRAQIKHLTREVERLEKRTQVQQEDIEHLLNENAQFREQLTASLPSDIYERDVPDAASYWSNAVGRYSTETLDTTDSTSFRVSTLRAKFEIGSEDTPQTEQLNSETVVRQVVNKNHEVSAYVSNYVSSVSTKGDANNTAGETIQFKSSRSVSDLKEYFERTAGKTQRSQSISGFTDIQQLRLAAAKAKIETTEQTENVTRFESAESILPYSVSDLKEMFESGTVKNQRTRSYSDVTGLVGKYLAEPERRKSTSSPVESPTKNQEFKLKEFCSTYEWNPGTTF